MTTPSQAASALGKLSAAKRDTSKKAMAKLSRKRWGPKKTLKLSYFSNNYKVVFIKICKKPHPELKWKKMVYSAPSLGSKCVDTAQIKDYLLDLTSVRVRIHSKKGHEGITAWFEHSGQITAVRAYEYDKK